MKDELEEPDAALRVLDSSFILHPSSLPRSAILLGGDRVEEAGGEADAVGRGPVAPGGHVPPAEARVLVVEEVRLVEAAELLEALAAHQQAAAGRPLDAPALGAGVGAALPARPREEEAGQRAGERRERPSRRLR